MIRSSCRSGERRGQETLAEHIRAKYGCSIKLRLDPQFTRDLLVNLCDRLDRANQYLEEVMRSESLYHESVQTVAQRLPGIITSHPDFEGA
ncbi:MAG: hypothetical protein CO096_02630 [Armatimonadetes bacterium CG_4_9_14_3_um_filter_66_14]|nr:MAG: hypothetical protein CO096_02630 [Armatimonadetes bacterium CG_4_9_14_3_um_filter_66_14]